MTFAFDMYDTVRSHPYLKNFCCVMEGHPVKIPFPLSKPYICFGTEKQSYEYLPGDANGIVESEIMSVRITVPNGFNSDYCRECARIVILAIDEYDTDKRIISVSAGKCAFDEHSYGYSLKLEFGLRPVRKIRGDAVE